ASPAGFVDACHEALALSQGGGAWLSQVDAALAANAWDETFARMNAEIAKASEARRKVRSIDAPAIRPAGRRKPYDYLIVGAGFAGSVLAERLTSQLGKRVLLVDRRPHFGGNAYDEKDAAGVLMHKYGPHIFHTNSEEVFR